MTIQSVGQYEGHTHDQSLVLETQPHPQNIGVDNKKIGMWLFIASDCMFFGALIATYLIYAGKSLVGPYPQDLFDIPLTTVSTFILLMSSLSVALAVHAVQQGEHKTMRRWLLVTVLMGLIFLGFQVFEFVSFVNAGLTLSANLFGTTFFVLTGTHGVHVALGVIWLALLYFTSLRGDTKRADAVNVEVAALYWHFVDVVWIVVFAVVYLMSDAIA